MSHRTIKNIFRKLFGSRIFFFFIGLALIWLAVGVGQESYHKYQLTRDINTLKAEIAELEFSNQELSNLIDYYQKETYLEKEARLKLNLQQPGETVVIVPESEFIDVSENSQNNDTDEFISQETDQRQESNVWKWWEYFFSKK